MIDSRPRAGRPRKKPGTEAAAMILQALERSGMTNTQLAEATGIQVPELSRILSDSAPNPTVQTVKRFADATGLALGKLAEGFVVTVKR